MSLYSTGPALFYVGVGDGRAAFESADQAPTAGTGIVLDNRGNVIGGTPPPALVPSLDNRPVFLGTCESPPEMHVKPYFRPVKSDDSGDSADDVLFAGEEGYIFAELNFFREVVYRRLQSRPNFKGQRGTSQERHVGRLMQRRGLCYSVWVVFPYSSKPTFLSSLAGLSAAGPTGVGGATGLGVPSPLTFAPPGPNAMPGGYRFASCYLPTDQMANNGTTTRRLVLMWHALRPPINVRQPAAPRVLYDHNMSGLPAPQ